MNMIDYNSFAQHWLNATDDGEQKTSLINDIDSKTNFHKSLIRTSKTGKEETFMNNLAQILQEKSPQTLLPNLMNYIYRLEIRNIKLKEEELVGFIDVSSRRMKTVRNKGL